MHVTDLYFWGARIQPDQLALSGDGGNFTYAETHALTNRIARRLKDTGLGPGHKFAVLSPNVSPAFVAMLGGFRAGLAWCNLNMRATVADIQQILQVGQVHVLFYHSAASAIVEEVKPHLPTLRELVCLDAHSRGASTLTSWLGDASDAPLDYRVPEEGIGFQGATGGTTGRSKLTQGSNRAVQTTVTAWSAVLHFDEPPVNLAVAPITHAAGFLALGMGQFAGTTVMMAQPDIGGIIEAIEKHRVSVLFVPPTLIYMILAHPKMETADTSSLRYLISAAAPIAPDKLIEAVDKFGPVVCQAYGQTESGFPTIFMPPHEIAKAVADPTKRSRLLACGRPTNIVEAMEIMSDDGRLLGPDELGEVVLRGPTVMNGYLGDPQATAEIQKYGWHHTGDIGKRDRDGFFYITDRKRDMIISGGFNIFPFEVESALMAHLAVQDCAVIGIPDEKWGEAVMAYVQLKPGAVAREEDLIAYAKDKIGSMKAPKAIAFADNLPRSPVGKVLRRALREPHWAGRARPIG